jgi:YHS domain-containing protein
MRNLACTLFACLSILPIHGAQTPAGPTAREALQPFNNLVGSWRCTGVPSGPREEQQKGFWVETLAIEWQFKGSDAWIKLAFDKGKHFSSGELRYRPATKDYELKLQTAKKENVAFAGSLVKDELTLERPQGADVHRLIFKMLHANRFLYRYETRPADKTLVAKHWSVGATKEGESFATGDGRPECIVSGGAGTMAVMYQGKTYYVCCSGCRSAFNEEPERYIKEYEESKAKKRDEKKPQPE